MPTRRVMALALTCLFVFVSCTTSDGETDSDADGFSDKAEEEAGTDPNDNRSKPPGEAPGEVEPDEEEEVEEEPEEVFVADETFAENPDDACNDGTAAVECSGELDSCEAGAVGDLFAVRCDGIVLRDGTVLSYAVQREAVADGLNVRWGCQAEPETGSTSCIFDVLENGQSLIDGPCEYDGALVDDALELSLPSICSPIPDEASQRISESTDFVGQGSAAAAFLNDQNQPVYTRVGTTAPISIEQLVRVL